MCSVADRMRFTCVMKSILNTVQSIQGKHTCSCMQYMCTVTVTQSHTHIYTRTSTCVSQTCRSYKATVPSAQVHRAMAPLGSTVTRMASPAQVPHAATRRLLFTALSGSQQPLLRAVASARAGALWFGRAAGVEECQGVHLSLC